MKHRPMDALEFNIHRQREKQLQHPIDEEDDEEDEESTGNVRFLSFNILMQKSIIY